MDKQYCLSIIYAKAGQKDWITVNARDNKIDTLEAFASGYKQALIACGWNNFTYNVQIELGNEPAPYTLTNSQDFNSSAWLKSPMPDNTSDDK